jgi:hypothetical protein
VKSDSRQKADLMLLNFVTDLDDPLLGFTHDWIQAIEREVGSLLVISGRVGRHNLSKEIHLESVNWVKNQRIRNVLKAIWTINRLIIKHRPKVIFTHMNYWFSIFALPASVWVRSKRVLWYAHYTGNSTLWLALKVNDLILTSVPEAFPLITPKLRSIGQAVNEQIFPLHQRNFQDLNRFVHFGRLDQVKRIDHIIDCLTVLLTSGHTSKIVFTQIGSPSNDEPPEFLSEVSEKCLTGSFEIHFLDSKQRIELQVELKSHQVFLHATLGSMDKAPLEAALSGLIVLSENQRIFRELGSRRFLGNDSDLVSQLKALYILTPIERSQLQTIQRQNVLSRHSMSSLGKRFMQAVGPINN